MTAVPYKIFTAPCVVTAKERAATKECSQADLLFLKNICIVNGLTPPMLQNQA